MIGELKAVIFDIDDTLFDREDAQQKTLRIIMREFSDTFAGIDEETAIDAFLESDHISVRDFNVGDSVSVARTKRSKRFLNILGLRVDPAEKITEMYVKAYPDVKAPIKNAESVVIGLARQFPLGVVSNGSPDVQCRKLKTLGIEHLFECIVLSAELGIQKPDPRIFWEAATMLKKGPEECLYIGDSYDTDVLGAKSARMKVCWFNPHGLQPSQIDVKPDFEISSLDRVLRIVGFI